MEVAAVDPAQLGLVERGRRPGHVLDAKALDEFRGRHERVVAVPPPEQRDVVADRLGQVAGVAQLLHRRGAMAL